MSATQAERSDSPTRPTRRTWWVLYALAACAVAVAVTTKAPMWFGPDEAALIELAVNHPFAAALDPRHTPPDTVYQPLHTGAWWLAYRAFGWTYWPYQFAHLLLWLAAVAAFYLMLRGLWGRARPALAATAMTAAVLIGLDYAVFSFARLGNPLGMALAFASVALAAEGWRRGQWWMIALSWPAALLALAGDLSTATYLPILHLAAAVQAGRARGTRWQSILAGAAVVAALTGAYVLAVRLVDGWSLAAPFFDWAEFVHRWRHSARLLRVGMTGMALTLLAGVAGAAQGGRLGIRRLPLLAATGLGVAALARWIHPAAALVLITLMSPRAWPFAAWAIAAQLALLLAGPAWRLWLLQGAFVFVPGFVWAIDHSQAGASLRRLYRRTRSSDRRLIQTAALLALVVLAAHFRASLGRCVEALRVTSERRQAARELTMLAITEISADGRLALVMAGDLGLPSRGLDAADPVRRAAETPLFDARSFSRLLAALSREDIHLIDLADLQVHGGWLLAGNEHELTVAERTLGPLGPPIARPRVHEGGLWRLIGRYGHAASAPAR